MALALFAITLFVSAFILFLVQPIIGKTILPKLGGTPQVWNTCMVFFQSVLLLGYFYTHAATTRLSQRTQLILHGILLFIPFIILLPFGGPFNITNWIPPPGANPIPSTLFLLAFVVGIPFFVVSTSAPLLQKWFGSTGHPAAKDPYFLYAASNLGSLLVLFPLYPVVIEPFMDLTPQKWMWTAGYGVLVILVLACIAMIWKPSGDRRLRPAGPLPPVEPASEGQPVPPPIEEPTTTAVTATPPAPAPAAAKSTAFKKGKPHPGRHHPARPALEPMSFQTHSDEMTTWRRLRWIGLAFVPSSLMLGVTTHITTDLSPIPLFWLIPLAIYLASFILVFSKWPVVWVDAPHTVLLYLQPAIICFMVFVEIIGPYLTGGNAPMFVPIFFDVLAFSVTALVCHGELAKDRPSTKHLTEFYLLMSVGGMLGGIFNGIIAPVVFIYVMEFGIAVVCACLLRPQMRDHGWTEDLLSNVMDQPGSRESKIHKGQPQTALAGFGDSTTIAMDFILPIGVVALMIILNMAAGGMPSGREDEGVPGFKLFMMFGIPLTIAAFYFGRPLRFALAIAGILIYHSVISSRGDVSLYADRSYFGILRVKFGQEGKTNANVRFTQLIHGHINHGMNIFKPDDKAMWGNPDKDFSRLPTTYYHTYGPVGIVMNKFNWFDWDWKNGKPNTYYSDARMPVSLISQAVASLGVANLPIAPMVDLWSEPPFATIGLGTGTMACYGRPFQHVHYYEIDNHVRRMSLPLKKMDYYFSNADLPAEIPFTYAEYSDERNRKNIRTYFNSLKDAIHRGCEVQVYMGDARLRMNLPYENFHATDAQGVPLQFDKVPPGGPENFYHMMVVDAFSSDAIPVHLITREAIEMYFKHLTEDGILCVHTSNRYVNLPLVVAAVANDLGYAFLTGHDNTPASGEEAKKKNLTIPIKELGRFTAEWVMVAKKPEYLGHLSDPPFYNDELKKIDVTPGDSRYTYWSGTTSSKKYLWTDDHSNLWNVLR